MPHWVSGETTIYSFSRIISFALLTSILCTSVASAQTAYAPMDLGKNTEQIDNALANEQIFIQRGYRFNHPELQDHIDRIAESVVPKALDDYIRYRIYLIRDPSPLVFSLPDGQIYLHTGLIARLANDAQLAAVIAHQAHHIANHDHIRATQSRRTKNVLVGSAIILGSGDDPILGSISFDTWDDLEYQRSLRIEYSDAMEQDADIASVGLIEQAGYPPMAALQALQRILSDPELSTPSPLSSWTTLDALEKRERRLEMWFVENRAPSGVTQPAAGLEPLLHRSLVEMTLDDYIRVDRPGAAIELIASMEDSDDDAVLLAANGDAYQALGPRPVRDTPKRWKWQQRQRELLTRDELLAKYLEEEGGPELLAHNTQIAIDSYKAALQIDEKNARAYRGLGNLYYQQADYRKAGRYYVNYLKNAPDSLERPLILEKLQHIKSELK